MSKLKPKSTATAAKLQRRTPSRMAKARLLERLRDDTKEVNTGGLLRSMRRLGYDEVPLDELQDRLSKLRTPLADLILLQRG